MAPAAGRAERPLGPAGSNQITYASLYDAILDGKPYPIRGFLGVGANPLLAHVGGLRGREALASLAFYAHADLFMNPTAALADIVLPVASSFERDALRIGFEISTEAQSHVQFRRALVPPPGRARSDTAIIFDLACRLGLGTHFWDGDIGAAYRHQLAPSGVTLEAPRDALGGLSVPLATRHRKHTETDANGVARGFATPTRKVELYSETLLDHGYKPLPEFVEPAFGPMARPDLAARFPLILTSAKSTLFCNSHDRGLPSLRRRAPYPEVEMHPDAAQARGIAAGAWVAIESPEGRVRARARLNASLDPRVVCGPHGWWQACEALGLPGYDPFGPEGASYNLLIGTDAVDPVSGTASLRAQMCEIQPAG